MKRVAHHGVIILSILTMTVVVICVIYTVARSSTRPANRMYVAKAESFEDLNTTAKTAKRQLFHRRGKVVILYSNQRSGSTFVGEFFNKNHDAFYLFEPLFSYKPSCARLYEERLRTLTKISMCDFRTVPYDYHRAYSINHYNDRAGRCLTDNICFIDNHPMLSQKYGSLCSAMVHGSLSADALNDAELTIREYETAKNLRRRPESCRRPYNMTLVSALCSSSYLVAYKVLRVCDLEKLDQVYRELTKMRIEVYVIHLVRDPRAIINSCLRTELRLSRVENKAIELCGRLNRNIQYVDDHKSGKRSSASMIADGRYLRVRHEDISFDPVKAAEEIYGFAGLPLPQKVQEWIEESSIDPDAKIKEINEKLAKEKLSYQERKELFSKVKELVAKKKDPYGTVRNSKSVSGKWRKSLKMETVSTIQDHCEEVIQKLGYKAVENEEQLRDDRIVLW